MPYTPWKVGQDVVVFPGAIGGGNWGGVTFNKKLNLVITNVMNAGQWGHLEEAMARLSAADQPAVSGGGSRRTRSGAGGGPPRSRETFRKVTPEGGRFWDPKTQYRANPTPWGELIAVNANTGDIAWRVPLGSFEELEKKGIKTGTTEPRRRDHHGRRPGVHRRDDRRLLPRVRRAQWRRAMVDQARACRRTRSPRPTWAGWQAVRRDHGGRRRIPAQSAR